MTYDHYSMYHKGDSKIRLLQDSKDFFSLYNLKLQSIQNILTAYG